MPREDSDIIWNLELKPRNIKVFGVPNERAVLHVEKWPLTDDNIELLVELSITPTSGKFFFVVFLRKLLPFKSESKSKSPAKYIH
jgi:hypothetical protein